MSGDRDALLALLRGIKRAIQTGLVELRGEDEIVEDEAVILAARTTQVPDPIVDSVKVPCHLCGSDCWADSDSQRLLKRGLKIRCITCAIGIANAIHEAETDDLRSQ